MAQLNLGLIPSRRHTSEISTPMIVVYSTGIRFAAQPCGGQKVSDLCFSECALEFSSLGGG